MFKEKDITVFIDGSKMDSEARIYQINPPDNTRMSTNAYDDKIEFVAVIASKKLIIHICTDSQASFMAMASYCFRTNLTIECLNSMNNLANNNNNEIYLICVPGPEKEKADELARTDSNTQFIGSEPSLMLI